jgi:hypothetical protein
MRPEIPGAQQRAPNQVDASGVEATGAAAVHCSLPRERWFDQIHRS